MGVEPTLDQEAGRATVLKTARPTGTRPPPGGAKGFCSRVWRRTAPAGRTLAGYACGAFCGCLAGRGPAAVLLDTRVRARGVASRFAHRRRPVRGRSSHV